MQPDEGPMACGEFGAGRLPEPEMIWLEIAELLGVDPGLLSEGGAGAREIAGYLEALRARGAGGRRGGRPRAPGSGGLLASIIPRSTGAQDSRRGGRIWRLSRRSPRISRKSWRKKR